MYRKTKETIVLQANRMVPNKWDELYNAAVKDQPVNQHVSCNAKPYRRTHQIAVIAACVCVVVAVFAMLPRLNKTGIPFSTEDSSNSTTDSKDISNASSTVPSNSAQSPDTTREETVIEPYWANKPLYIQFPNFTYNGIEYNTNGDSVTVQSVKKLKKIVLEGYDIYTDKGYSKEAIVYELPSISNKCAMVLRFEGSDKYFPYINFSYAPITLGHLINDLNLHSTLKIGNIHYKIKIGNEIVTMQYTLSNDSAVWEYLLSNTSIPNCGGEYYSEALMDISINIDEIGYENKSIAVNSNGYVQTNILETAKTFYIGKEKVESFIDFVIKNGNAKIINRIPIEVNNSGTVITSPGSENISPELGAD